MDERPVLSRFFLYQTLSRVFLVGTDKSSASWKVLKCAALLKAVNDGNLAHGGLQLVCQAVGVIGCFKFLEGYYLLLVTKKRHVGTLCGHKVYGIDSTALVPLISSATHRAFARDKEAAAAEQRYRKLLAGVSLNTDFFFSYSLPLWRTVQRGFGPQAGAAADPPFASDRVWNEWLTRPLREAVGHDGWVLPLVHGFWQQRQLALFGRTLTLTLVARRSRQFAGTRYRKRGVNDAGFVANDVEVEQVVEAGTDWRTGEPLISSVVQVRGSIPLFWAQSNEAGRLKPEITLQRFDPLYAATRKHFDDLRRRYGDPVAVLNLVKLAERHPRESLLGREFAAAVEHLNRQAGPGQEVQYVAWDLSRHAKADSRHLLQDLQRLLAPLLRATGLFVSGGSGTTGASLQHGVLRTNCVDCLDRTNVAQFAAGLLSLGLQLHALGISEGPGLDPDSSLARQLLDGYECMGNTLSLQYGGSEAHTAFFQRQRGDWEPATQSRDVLTSIRRYYSNAYTDAEKQDAINLLLGSFVPQHGRPHLWELGSDYYLHSGRGGVAGLARQLFLGVPSSAPAASSSSLSRHSVASGQGAGAREAPPSREGSFHGGRPGPLAPAAGGGGSAGSGPDSPHTAMVSLSDGVLGPALSASFGRSAEGAEVARSAAGAAAGSSSVAEPPAAPTAQQGGLPPSPAGAKGRGGLAAELSSDLSPRGLSVSTDGAEVPTLSQLVEGASPTWHPSSAPDKATLELLVGGGPGSPLSSPPALSSLAVLTGAGSAPLAAAAGAAAATAVALAATAAVVPKEQRSGAAGGAEQPAGPAATAGPSAGSEGSPEATGTNAVAGLGRGLAPKEVQNEHAPAQPHVERAPGQHITEAASQTGALAVAVPSTDTSAGSGSTPSTPASQASPRASSAAAAAPPGARQAQQGHQQAQQGVGLRKPPPSPRRSKLESFDKLISKPPNAIRQVRLTAAPSVPARTSSLASWLPSPGRSRPPQPPSHQSQQAQQAQHGPAPAPPSGTALASRGGAPLVSRQGGEATPEAAAHIAAALSNLGAFSAPRLFRSSSDNTLLSTSLSEVSAMGLSGGDRGSFYSPQPPSRRSSTPTSLGGGSTVGSEVKAAIALTAPSASDDGDVAPLKRRVSFDAGAAGAPDAVSALAAAVAAPAPAGTLLRSHVSASAAELRELAGAAVGLAGSGGTATGTAGTAKGPLVTPTGYLVVLDAWSQDGSGPGGRDTAAAIAGGPQIAKGLHAGSAGTSRPASAASGKPPRKGRFPGFSLGRFVRSKSQAVLASPRSASSSAPATPASTPAAAAAAHPAAGSAVPPAAEGVDGLGLGPRAAAGWWVGGADPVALMLAEEARLREQLTRQLEALSMPPTPAEQRAQEQYLAGLTRPSWALTLGSGGQGAAAQWRQQSGLLGAPTLAQAQLASLAEQAQQAQPTQQAQQGLAF
ncbi:hypothetical protein N2152v2_004937 [Parachlorella kessleri]